jgi:hypothetical protein
VKLLSWYTAKYECCHVFSKIGVSSKLQKSMQSSDRHMDSMFPGASFDERCLFHLAYCLVVRSWKD